MKIVHLIDYFQPALGYQETYLAREQLKLGHCVTVVTSDRYAPFPDYDHTVKAVLGERILTTGRGFEEGIPVWRLPVRFEKRARCWLEGLAKTLDMLQPDVVHAHGVAKLTSLHAVLLRSSRPYRLLVDDHMHRTNLDQSFSGRLFYFAFRAIAAPFYRRRVDALAAITDETAEIVRGVFGLTRPPVQTIELGVDSELFHRDDKERALLRWELGVAADDFLVIYTGKIIPSKAPHLLVQALAECPTNVKVLLVGSAGNEYRRTIDELIERHSLDGRVLFRPAVKQVELPRYYSAADAGCWPRETSMAMLEAAACELPIVVVDEGVEARVRYDNGLQYREGNVAQLSHRLTYLAEDRLRSRAMGGRGRQLVEDAHSWITINRQFLEAYIA